MRRIIVAKKNLKIGHKIREQDILFMRHPVNIQGLKPKEYYNVVGKTLLINVNNHFPILKEHLYDK